MSFIRRRKHRAAPERGPPVDRARAAALRRLERRAATRFRDLSLLNQALCHRSYAHEAGPGGTANNEKLEFLGDAVLSLAISDELYATSGRRTEGELARIKSFVISEDALYHWALQLGLPDYLLIGHGEERSGGRGKKAIVADAMEAIIGAYYLDSGGAAAQEFVLRHLRPEIHRVLSNTHRQDYKTLLQVFAQKRYHASPRYRVVRQEGPDHDRTFWIDVKLNGHVYGPGTGKNKKEAEQGAAACAYAALRAAGAGGGGVPGQPAGGAGGANRER